MDPNSFNQHVELFERHFDLNTRLPNRVFSRGIRQKFVIGESGDFHNAELFERLSGQYGDKELKYLVIEPEGKEFHSDNKFLSYSIKFDTEFRKNWKGELLEFGQAQNNAQKILPRMVAGLQCYVGSSETWCSYHDNHDFELDIFCVPDTCDTLAIFGKASWNFEDFREAVELHKLKFSEQESLKLKENYFM
jgi:hypothetical protein